MPIVMKTESLTAANTNNGSAVIKNMAKATAEAIGVPLEIITDTESHKEYFIPTDLIGYSGLGIYLEYDDGTNVSSYSDDKYCCGIVNKPADENPPDKSDESPNIYVSFSGNVGNNNYNRYETCVMVCDDAKDTVLFDIHPGSTLHGSDYVDLSGDRSFTSFTLFFAKDVNGGILCGLGRSHIFTLRTLTSKMAGDSKTNGSKLQKFRGSADFLHLTKMINYLDPTYPEMKSAYVSVARPFESVEPKTYLSTTYANGKRWARAGIRDSWEETPGNPVFYPIEPYVSY